MFIKRDVLLPRNSNETCPCNVFCNLPGRFRSTGYWEPLNNDKPLTVIAKLFE